MIDHLFTVLYSAIYIQHYSTVFVKAFTKVSNNNLKRVLGLGLVLILW